MPITYTNWKGVTYYLCRGTTKTGKPRYYFAREPRGEPVEEIPEGWEIRESPNGIVSLARKRPAQIQPDEVAAVQAALKRHPKADNYRVVVKGKQIVVYERVGPNAEELIEELQGTLQGSLAAAKADDLAEVLDQRAKFSPVMRFILVDEERRTFHAERWCYSGSIDDWIHLAEGTIFRLAGVLVPRLGTEAFFDPELPGGYNE